MIRRPPSSTPPSTLFPCPTRFRSTGDLGGCLPGVPGASAGAKAVNDGNGPDLFMAGTTYDARDSVARLSVALDKPVLTNNTDVEVDGDAVVVTTQVFGGTKLVKTKFTAGGTQIAQIGRAHV